MTDLNHVVLIGRLTRDLGSDERSFGYVGNGMAKANVSIAVNRSRKQADGSWVDEVSYFDITIWGKTAENLKPYLTKGKMIAVDGHLKQDRWDKDGQKFSKVSIVADNVQL
jgi:single-strand DNA-binding protein